MKRYLFALGLALAAFTGCAIDNEEPAEVPQAADTQAVEVPEALQPITNATCSALRGSCISRSLCSANDGRQLSATGCSGSNICCGFNPCLNANARNQCTSRNICTANGVQQSLSGCSSTQVCCRF